MKSILIISTILFSFNFSAQKMGKFKDKRDGKVYPTVKIGEQTWMAENLNVATFRNGDPIPEAKTKEQWIEASKSGKPAWCYYENRAIQDDATNGSKYGKLYNWFAVNDSRGIAPIGWHIPSDDEWTILINTLGGEEFAGYKLKSFSGCMNYGNGKYKSGFSGLPGGCRFYDGSFSFFGNFGMWWSSTETDISWNGWYRSFDCNQDKVFRVESNKVEGLSVRCVKD